MFRCEKTSDFSDVCKFAVENKTFAFCTISSGRIADCDLIAFFSDGDKRQSVKISIHFLWSEERRIVVSGDVEIFS